MARRFALFLLACVFAAITVAAGKGAPGQSPVAARTILDLDADWRFSRGDFPNAAMPAFDDSGWRRVDLPHDWSSEGPFSAEYGSGNGYAPGGVGWYRKHVAELDARLKGKLATIEFDGVYDNAEVWVNGQYVGGRPYGYSSFECKLTPHLKFQGDNVIAVRVDHSRFADSRWYTGSGIYRHVRLRLEDPLHIGHWGTRVTTPAVNADVRNGARGNKD